MLNLGGRVRSLLIKRFFSQDAMVQKNFSLVCKKEACTECTPGHMQLLPLLTNAHTNDHRQVTTVVLQRNINLTNPWGLSCVSSTFLYSLFFVPFSCDPYPVLVF